MTACGWCATGEFWPVDATTTKEAWPCRAAVYALAVLGAVQPGVRGGGPGDTAIVVYNTRLAESKELAFYYAARREVPTNHVFGFDLPTTETLTREQFRERLQQPLLKLLEGRRLIEYQTDILPATRERPGDVVRRPHSARIRYAVLCSGVPLTIQADNKLKDDAPAHYPPALRRNEAAVDSELALLPVSANRYPLFGPLPNPFYGATNAAQMHAARGVLMVARLDGPSFPIARGLVDKALEAETNGLWGRAYFDARGLTNTSYKLGDDWIRAAAAVVRRQGFETVLDEAPATFQASFPLSQIAFYAGWYDAHVSGPFRRASVEFTPGAIAYHLHSYSAQTIRSTNTHWVGPLLAKGATATLGCVAEPYLDQTPELSVFFSRLLGGASFGEAAYAALPSLSWQITVVGDPLYRPFGRPPQVQHAELERRQDPLIEWSHLRVVNLNLVTDLPVPELIRYLEDIPVAKHSAVLQEKLGDLLLGQGRFAESSAAYERALQLEPSPQQRVRVTLSLGRALALADRPEPAVAVYRQFLKDQVDFADPLAIYQRLIPLLRKLGWNEEAARYEQEVSRGQAAAPQKP